jgi:hypothetical protein
VVEAVAGTSIRAKLLPELTEFKSLGDSKPESIKLLKELVPAGCGWRRRNGRGLCLRGIHSALSGAVIIEAREGNRSNRISAQCLNCDELSDFSEAVGVSPRTLRPFSTYSAF